MDAMNHPVRTPRYSRNIFPQYVHSVRVSRVLALLSDGHSEHVPAFLSDNSRA